MKFSVVTISMNQGRYLPFAIESVLSQVGVEFEYIVIDAGSTDGSRNIIESYRSKITHIIFEPDLGPADGLNKGLSLAQGQYFYYLNADDEVEAGVFAKAAELLRKCPDVDVLYANGAIINEAGDVIRKVYSAPKMTASLYARGIAVIVQQSSFIKTSTLRRVGGFNVMNRTCWDGEAFFAIAIAGGKFRRVWDYWGRFRVYPETISGSGKHEAQMRLDHLRIARTLGGRDTVGSSKIVTFFLWAQSRITDWRRWPSYARGSFKPTDVTGGARK